MSDYIYIFMEGGCLSDAFDGKGNCIYPNIVIFDLDDGIRDGECPVCDAELRESIENFYTLDGKEITITQFQALRKIGMDEFVKEQKRVTHTWCPKCNYEAGMEYMDIIKCREARYSG